MGQTWGKVYITNVGRKEEVYSASAKSFPEEYVPLGMEVSGGEDVSGWALIFNF